MPLIGVDIEKLKLWTPLQTLITSAPTNALKMQALWVAGTALQNNPAAQDAVRCLYLLSSRAEAICSILRTILCRP